MRGRFFLDTDVFVCSFDKHSPQKRKKARQLINDALRHEKGFVSSQVVQEFINVALRKFEKPLSTLEAVQYTEKVLEPLCEIFPTMVSIQQALQLRDRFQLQWYDA